MCNVGAVGLGMDIGGSFAGAIGELQSQKAFNEYSKLQTQSTLNNYINNTKLINNRYAEEQEAAYAETQDIYIKNLQAQATAQASAAGSGVEGISIENLFNGYDRATAVSDFTAARNLHYKKLQYREDLEGLRANALSSLYGQQRYTGNALTTFLSGMGDTLSHASKVEFKSNLWDSFKDWKNNRTAKSGEKFAGRYSTGGLA